MKWANGAPGRSVVILAEREVNTENVPLYKKECSAESDVEDPGDRNRHVTENMAVYNKV